MIKIRSGSREHSRVRNSVDRGHWGREGVRLTCVSFLVGAALVWVSTSVAAPPVNDDCTGAIVVPNGPYPFVTAPVDITEATPQGSEDPIFSCATTDATVWYSFTPAVSGSYTFSTCAGNGATGSNVYDTVLAVFESTGGACPNGAVLGCNDTATGCSAGVPGALYVDQSTVSADLTGGNTYYVVAGHWSGDTGGVTPGFNQISIKVDVVPAPPNDTCSAPTALALDRVVTGTTVGANNDYLSLATTACFSGLGQIRTTSPGIDVVFSFTAPADGKYSVRYVQDDTAAALRGQNPVLYLSHECPASAPAGPAVSCNPLIGDKGVNRITTNGAANGNRSEVIDCLPMTTGQTIYVFFDDGTAGNAGGPLALEVTNCLKESEPNDTIATATPFVPNSGCFMEGSSSVSGPSGDIDFYDLGAPPAGSKIFAAVDSAASNNSDYQMRVTTATDTLGFDDDDGTSWIGSNAPIIAGVFSPGGEIYARVNSKPLITTGTCSGGSTPGAACGTYYPSCLGICIGGTTPGAACGAGAPSSSCPGTHATCSSGTCITSPTGNEPYSLFARIETGPAQNEDLPDPGTGPDNGTGYDATHVTGGGFVKGIHATSTDQDCFRFVAHEGDNIAVFSDNNPSRLPGTIVNTWPILRDLLHGPPTALRFTGQITRNLLTPSPGTLTGVTPSVVSEFWDYRARYTGTYMACFYPETPGTSGAPPAGAFPLPYQGSISLNCGPVPGPTPADVSITQTGPAGPVNTGGFAKYTITVTNNDATGIAQDVRVVDSLPPEVVFVSLTVNDGFAGNNNRCLTLPTPGTADAPVDCTNYSIAPGASVVYTLSVQLNNCIGAGHNVANTASITSYTTDDNPANDSATAFFTTSQNGTCTDLFCDGISCARNLCTINEHCDGGVCVVDPTNCDDSDVCTDDTCVPTTGCIHTVVDNPCDDGDPCTQNDTCHAGVCTTGTDPVVCGVSCPQGFVSVVDGCRRSYDIDVTLLDNLIADCDGTGQSRHNNCTGENYGFHWTDFGGSLAAVTRVDVQLESGVGWGGFPSSLTLNGVPAGSFYAAHNFSNCDLHGTVFLPDLAVGAYAKGGLNVISITPGDACEGLSWDSSLGGSFARVTVTYLPLSGPSDPCVVGECNHGTGACSFSNLPDGTACDDRNACTTSDACSAGSCAGGPAPDCDDGSICTTDACSPVSGCVHEPVDCSDGDGCTLDTCGEPAGCEHTVTCVESGPPQTVSPGETASTDPEGDGATPNDQIETAVTTPSGGDVSIQEGPATEPLPSGYDVLDLQSVITAPPATIGNPLVLVFRVDATALPHGYVLAYLTIFRNGVAVADCSDSSGQAVPDPCVSSRVVLDDADVQVTVLTSEASIWNIAFPNCDDSNPCTDDFGAYPACIYLNNTVVCDDGNACTVGDRCQEGNCTSGTATVCTASDQCHVAGTCDPATGTCSNPSAANGTSCSDGNACTVGDTCQEGNCTSGTATVCTASDQCHVAGTCDPSTGVCSNPNKTDGSACHDGSACTQTDTCQAGRCTGGHYSWSGVLQPVNSDGTSVFKRGSTIPIKFKLTGACAGDPNLTANIYFYKISSAEGPVNEATSSSSADTGTLFRYSVSDDQYIYNLGTKAPDITDGSWNLGVDLHDGMGIQVVKIGLRK